MLSANRNQLELEDLIGFFVNSLVLRAAVPTDSLARLAERLR